MVGQLWGRRAVEGLTALDEELHLRREVVRRERHEGRRGLGVSRPRCSLRGLHRLVRLGERRVEPRAAHSEHALQLRVLHVAERERVRRPERVRFAVLDRRAEQVLLEARVAEAVRAAAASPRRLRRERVCAPRVPVA